MKIRSVYLSTLSWHDKTYGNSYYSTQLHVNGNLVAALPFRYGYERMDEHEALELLKKLGYVPQDSRTIYHAMEAIGADYYRSKNCANKATVKQHGEPVDLSK